VNDKVQFRTIDGRTVETFIAGIESIMLKLGGGRALVIIVRELKSEEIPRGTEIWIPDASSTEATASFSGDKTKLD